MHPLNEKILVVGETCVDVFIYGTLPRLSPEAPAPIFVQERVVTTAGMAANVAANLRALGVACDLVTHPEVFNQTRYVDASRNHLLLCLDEAVKVTPFKRTQALCADDYAAVVVPDYNKGFLSEADIAWLAEQNPRTFVATKRPLGPWLKDAAFIKINEQAWKATRESESAAVNSLVDKLMITLGAKGCNYRGRRFLALQCEEVDSAGAGETFLAALAARYVKNSGRKFHVPPDKHIEECISFANQCAGRVVRKRGSRVVEGLKA